MITGGAGFIGGNLAHFWSRNNPFDKLYILDALTYAGNLKTIQNLIDTKKITFIQGDINDGLLVEKILCDHKITHLINLAAESHVDRSIKGPKSFLSTNVLGTFSLLEAFRSHWNKNSKPESFRFLHVSTDEVFGSLNEIDPKFEEKTPYDPRSPYSSSKAASDHLVMAWYHTYGLPVLLSNCSNNYGPFQFPEKLIPLSLINILNGKPIPIYGDGKNIRDWLYVTDHCKALEIILSNGIVGNRYCIGGNNELRNIDLVEMLCSATDKITNLKGIKLTTSPSAKLIEYVKDREGHDKRYSVNINKIKTELNWEPKVKINEGINNLIYWYLENRDWWEPLLKIKN